MADTSKKPAASGAKERLVGEWKDRQEYVRHFATHAMAGLCARAPLIGRPDILCRQAWEIAECMVAQEQRKLLTQGMEERLQPPAEEPAAAASR